MSRMVEARHRMHQIKIIKAVDNGPQNKVVQSETDCAKIESVEIRAFLLGELHETVMKVARLRKVLKLDPPCERCGRVL